MRSRQLALIIAGTLLLLWLSKSNGEEVLREQFAGYQDLFENVARNDPVLDLAWMADGSRICTVTKSSLTTWDWRLGQEERRIQVTWPGDERHLFAFEPTKDFFAIAAVGRLEIRRLQTAKIIASTGDLGRARPTGIALGPDGSLLIGTNQGKLCAWHWGRAEESISCSEPHSGEVSALAFDPRTRRIYTAALNEIGISKLEEADSIAGNSDQPYRVAGYFGNWGYISSLAISSDSSKIAFGSAEGRIWLGERDSIERSKLVAPSLAHVSSLQFSPDSSVFASGHRDGRLMVWSVWAGRQLLSFAEHALPVQAIEFDPQGKLFASASSDGTTRLWSVPSGERVGILEGHARKIRHVALSPQGRWLAVHAIPDTVFLWNVETGTESFRLPARYFRKLFKDIGAVTSLAAHPKGTSVAIGFKSGDIQVLRTDEGGATPNPRAFWHGSAVVALAFDSMGSRLASGGSEQYVEEDQQSLILVWDLTKGTSRTFDAGTPVRALAFENGNRLAAAMQSRSLQRRDLETGEIIGEKRVAETVNSLASLTDLGILVATNQSIQSWVAPEPFGLRKLAGAPEVWKLLSLGGLFRVWVDGDRTLHVDRYSSASESYEEVWRLLSGARGTWVGCARSGSCRRQDDGTLLVAISPEKEIRSLLPQEAEKPNLQVSQESKSVSVPHGESVPISVQVKNTGKEAIYWLKLRHAGGTSDDPTIFIPPGTYLRLDPEQEIELVGHVATKSRFEAPRSRVSKMDLELITGSGYVHALESLEIWSLEPSLSLDDISWVRKADRLTLRVHNKGAVDIPEARVDLLLDSNLLGSQESIRLRSEDEIELQFSMPKEISIEDGKLILVIQTLANPLHRWSFRLREQEEAVSGWPLVFAATSAAGMLLFLSWYFYYSPTSHPVVVKVTEDPNELLKIPADQLITAKKLMERTRRLNGLLRQAGVPRHVFDEALLTLAAVSHKDRCQRLAHRLGAEVVGFGDEDGSQARRLLLGGDFPLNLNRCVLELPNTGSSVDQVLSKVRALYSASNEVVLIISQDMELQDELSLRTGPENPWVAPTSRELTKLLLGPDPREILAGIVGGHVAATTVSPYQTSEGIKKAVMFFGRETQLMQLRLGDPKNYLVVGARQVGKSSLLRALKRELDQEDGIACHYLVLNDYELIERLAALFGLEAKEAAEMQIRDFLQSSRERHLVLIDEVDSFVHHDEMQGFSGSQFMRSLSEEGKCHFILAGFWDLFSASRDMYRSPLKNFGEVIRVGKLEHGACYRLVTEPMARMGIKFEKDSSIQKLIAETGQRANLLSIICNEILHELSSQDRTISEFDIQAAISSSAVRDALEIGGLTDHDSRLQRIIIFATVEQGEFSVSDLMERIRELGVRYSRIEVEKELEILALTYVLEPIGAARFTYQVPLYRKMLLRRDPARSLRDAVEA